jgi:hypothetical protein
MLNRQNALSKSKWNKYKQMRDRINAENRRMRQKIATNTKKLAMLKRRLNVSPSKVNTTTGRARRVTAGRRPGFYANMNNSNNNTKKNKNFI